MAKKRVSRSRKRQLETPDEFITFSSKLIEFGTVHKEKMLITGGVILALIVGFLGKQYYAERAENKAFALLGQSRAKYESIARRQSPVEAYIGVEKDFQQIVEKYSGREGGKIARIVFANVCFNGGDYDRAVGLYKLSLDDFNEIPFIRTIILNSLGHAYEKKKEYAAAIKHFEMALPEANPVMKSDALFNLGILYAEMGLNDKSEEAFKKIVSDHSDSLYYEVVRDRLSG